MFGRSWRRALPATALTAAAGLALYYASADFRLRVDDTVRAAQDVTVDNANLSTFALVSNALITARVLSIHPLAGNGLGSHRLSHDAYIAEVPGVAMFEEMSLHGHSTMDQLNASDANSLLLRLLSETGAIGVLLTALFIARFKSSVGEWGAINSAVLVYFFVKLLRVGHYFSPETFFFVLAYCLTGMRGKEAAG
jgi:hypothetical protein